MNDENDEKISLWTMSLLTLLFVAGCAEQKPEQTTAETTTEALLQSPLKVNGKQSTLEIQ